MKSPWIEEILQEEAAQGERSRSLRLEMHECRPLRTRAFFSKRRPSQLLVGPAAFTRFGCMDARHWANLLVVQPLAFPFRKGSVFHGHKVIASLMACECASNDANLRCEKKVASLTK